MAAQKRPSDRKPEYLKDIERIFHPRTVEDMAFALSVPLSPVYKEFMTQLSQEAENEFIIELLIEKFMLKEHKMREKEKEAILRQMWMKDDAEKEAAHLYVSDMHKLEDARAKLAVLTRQQLDEMEKRLRNDLKKLDGYVKTYQAAMTILNSKKTQNSQKYKATVTKAFGNKMQQVQFTVKKKDANGKVVPVVLDKPLAKLKEVIAAMPVPVDMVTMVEKAFIEAEKAYDMAMAQKKTSVAFMPPPPPPPPLPKPTSTHYAHQNNVNLEFNFIAKKLADSETFSDILGAIRENKPQLKTLFCINKEEKAEQCAIFNEALKIGKEMRNCARQLDVAREMHNQKSQLLDELVERKKRLEAEEKALNPAGNSRK